MPKPITMMQVTLLAAVAAGMVPQLTPRTGQPPAPVRPATTAGSPVTTPGNPDKAVPGVDQTTPKLEIVTAAKPVVFRKDSSGNYQAHLIVRSKIGVAQNVAVSVKLQDREGHEMKDSDMEIITKTFPLEPFATIVQDLTVKVSAHGVRILPATGQLWFTSSIKDPTCIPANPEQGSCKLKPDPKPVYADVSIPAIAGSSSSIFGFVLFVPLIIATAVVLITALSLWKKGIGLFRVMGSATWSFKDSWGSNVTIAAALLGALLGLTVFPDNPHIIDKNSYSMLQALLTALVATAPLVYGLIRRQVQAVNANVAVSDTQGYVLFFLIAGGLVLWGAIGQVFTLGVLTEEFIQSGVLEVITGRVLETLAALFCVLLIVYGLRSLYWAAKRFSTMPEAAGTQPKLQFSPGTILPDQVATQLPVPRIEWSLL